MMMAEPITGAEPLGVARPTWPEWTMDLVAILVLLAIAALWVLLLA